MLLNNRILVGVLCLTGCAVIQAVPPPRVDPILRIEFDVVEKKPTRVLEVFAGEYLRVDWIDKTTGKVDQHWWTKDEWKEFGTFIGTLKLATAGQSAVESDSPEGKKLLKRIDEAVTQPAKAKAEKAAKQAEQRNADKPKP